MKLIVTDLTRFKNPDIVCLAGINPETGQCIRPMLLNQEKLEYLTFKAIKERKVIPGSWLEGGFTKILNLKPPHVEDHSISSGLKMNGPSSSVDFKNVLDNSSVNTIQAGFGSQPENRLYSLAKTPPISIITLKLNSPRMQFQLIVDTGFNSVKIKAHITDESGCKLSYLPVTDLGFSDHLGKIRESDPTLAGLNSFLQNQTIIYVRLGLTRKYAPTPDRDGYWVQVNGIYSFPNYRQDLRIYD